MRVLYLCVGMNDLGGTSSHLLNIARGATAAGVEATFLIGTKIPERLRRHFQEASAPVIIIERYKRWFYLPFLWSLVRLLREQKIEVLHSFQLQSDIVAAVAGWLAGVRVRISSFEGRLVYGATRMRRWALTLLNRLARPTFTCNVFISRYLLEVHGAAHRIPFRKRQLNYLGLPTSWFAAPLQIRRTPERLRVGFVGRLDSEKGYEIFIEAVRLLLDQSVQADFCMVGDGQRYSDALRRLRLHGLEAAIELRGWREDIKNELGRLDVVILPSHEEGLSFVALEALSQRRLVIATRVGGLPEIIQDQQTGILVAPESPGALARAIAESIADWPARSQYGEAGYEFVRRHFGIHREIEGFAKLYARQLRSADL